MRHFTIQVKLLLIIMVVLCGIPVVIYVYRFFYSEISQDPNHWGVLGDFIGGILNPLIGIFNILFLVIISYNVARWENDRHKYEFIHGAYIKLSDELNRISMPNIETKTLGDCHRFVRSFTFNYLFLFDGDKKTIFQHRMADLSSSIQSLMFELENDFTIKNPLPETEVNKQLFEAISKIHSVESREESIKKAFYEFESSVQNVLGFMQVILTKGNYKIYATNYLKKK